MTNSKSELTGYLFMVSALLLFAIVPYYLQFLSPLSGNLFFAYRIITQLVIGIIILAIYKQLPEIKQAFNQLNLLPILLLTTLLVGVQWWAFYWSPVNGQTINLAMGYFLLPLTISLSGRLFLKEPMSQLQWLAVAVAFIGVAMELIRSGAISWITLLVCLGYPPYFLLRRKINLSTKTNFVLENILLLPISIGLLYFAQQNNVPIMPYLEPAILLLLGLGLLGTLSMLFLVTASKLLNFTVFGMLGYLEPVLLILVAVFVLDETVSTAQIGSYSCFMMAVLLVIIDNLRKLNAD